MSSSRVPSIFAGLNISSPDYGWSRTLSKQTSAPKSFHKPLNLLPFAIQDVEDYLTAFSQAIANLDNGDVPEDLSAAIENARRYPNYIPPIFNEAHLQSTLFSQFGSVWDWSFANLEISSLAPEKKDLCGIELKTAGPLPRYALIWLVRLVQQGRVEIRAHVIAGTGTGRYEIVYQDMDPKELDDDDPRSDNPLTAKEKPTVLHVLHQTQRYMNDHLVPFFLMSNGRDYVIVARRQEGIVNLFPVVFDAASSQGDQDQGHGTVAASSSLRDVERASLTRVLQALTFAATQMEPIIDEDVDFAGDDSMSSLEGKGSAADDSGEYISNSSESERRTING